MPETGLADCVFCEQPGGRVLWRDALCRVVRAEVDGYPEFLRVVCNRHVREMTDLEPGERDAMMRVVFAAETALRELCRPEKVNLASLGNQVPHVHWHVIGRRADDPHYPGAPWGAGLRAPSTVDVPTDLEPRLSARLAALLD